jgi:hypothetical protein
MKGKTTAILILLSLMPLLSRQSDNKNDKIIIEALIK